MCFSPVGKRAEVESGRAWKDPLVSGGLAGTDCSADPAARRCQIPGSSLWGSQLSDRGLHAGAGWGGWGGREGGKGQSHRP